jgi:hypothetical protein
MGVMAADPTRRDAHAHAHAQAHTDAHAHDILAAEEFGMPAPDPRLHRDEAHDVLAAEEFVVPAPDPRLHHGPVLLPADPTGIAEAHDVLAAEEFALPAPVTHALAPSPVARGLDRGTPSRGATVALGALGLLLVRRRRSRRRRRA